MLRLQYTPPATPSDDVDQPDTTPAGVEPATQSWEFDPGMVASRDAETLELIGGATWSTYAQFRAAYADDRPRALRAAVWLCLRRDQPDLDFDSFDPPVSSISRWFTEHELRARLKWWQDNTGEDEHVRANAIKAVGDALARMGVHVEVEAGEQDPKAGR